MNEKQKLFVAHYLVNKNATEAAKAAGYSEDSAHVQGCRMLKNDKVQAAITEKIQSITDKLGIGPEYVLGRLKEVVERCLQKEQVMEFDPNSKSMVPTGEWKFEHAGANKALELLGKYQKLFTDNISITEDAGFAAKLSKFKKPHGK